MYAIKEAIDKMKGEEGMSPLDVLRRLREYHLTETDIEAPTDHEFANAIRVAEAQEALCDAIRMYQKTRRRWYVVFDALAALDAAKASRCARPAQRVRWKRVLTKRLDDYVLGDQASPWLWEWIQGAVERDLAEQERERRKRGKS